MTTRLRRADLIPTHQPMFDVGKLLTLWAAALSRVRGARHGGGRDVSFEYTFEGSGTVSYSATHSTITVTMPTPAACALFRQIIPLDITFAGDIVPNKEPSDNVVTVKLERDMRGPK